MTGRDLPLRFATWQTIMCLVGAPKGVKTWHCPLPNHRDADPSFSAGPGREPGTTVVACSCGQQDELLAHFRKLGCRLGPMRMAEPKPKRANHPVTAVTSVAFRALTPSERQMYHLIADGQALTYTGFMEAGVRRASIPGGSRAMQALGLIGVCRFPRKPGCVQYGQNEYWTVERWSPWEPMSASKEAKRIALSRARARAKAARKAGEDISEPLVNPETSATDLRISEVPFATIEEIEKTEAAKRGSEDSFVRYQQVGENPPNSDLRISEVPVRGSSLSTESDVGRRYSSISQDSSRPAPFKLGARGGGGSADATPEPPLPDGDPGPTSEDGYGADPASGMGPSPEPAQGQSLCCYACVKAGECVEPGGVCLNRRSAACRPP